MRNYILDENKKPIPEDDIPTWGKWFEEDTSRGRVALDIIQETHVKVSTVFLGLDHSFGSGDPILWETMIFGGVNDGYQDRYSSHEDAVRGHAKALEIAKSNIEYKDS